MTGQPVGVLASARPGATRADATLDDGLPVRHRHALSHWDATLPAISSAAGRDELTSRRKLRVRLSAPPTVELARSKRHREMVGRRPSRWMLREAGLSVGGRQTP